MTLPKNLFHISIVMAILCIAIACSNGKSPIEPVMDDDLGNTNYLPESSKSSTNIFGAYELIIDAYSMTAELTAHRESAIGESWIVSGRSYFDTQPCKDCFKISALGYEDGLIVIHFDIRHPFEPGDTEQDPSARNRLDLDVFDLAMIVAPKPLESVSYPLLDIDIPEYIIHDPDGFTNELSDLLGSEIALPYVLVIDDSASTPPSSTFNKFEMGASADFETKFPVTPGQTLVFDLYLTFGYGFSAVLEDRLDPKYYNPEFNRKAAWKVAVYPPGTTQGSTWDDSDDSTEYDVTIHVYDWQFGANVNPDLEEQNDIYASSNVDRISVEIPGMTDSVTTVDGTSAAPGSTGMPDSPLYYSIPIANENLLSAGEYVGLVAVYDERLPGEFSDMRDYLIHTPDAGKNLDEYEISAYVTYQTFIATIVEGTCGPITGRITSPTCPVTGLDNGAMVNFTVTASSAQGGDPIVLYEIDYNYDGVTFNASDSNTNGVFSNAGPFTVPEPCYTNVPYSFSVAFRATDSCNPPNETVFATCRLTIENCNTDGNLIWVKQAGGQYAESFAVTSLSNNATVATGYFNGDITFGEGEPNEITLSSVNQSDIFVARYNADGTLAWAKRAGGSQSDIGNAITTLSNNSVVVVGDINGAATFGEGETNETTLNPGAQGIFLARYNRNGVFEWATCATASYGGRDIAALSDDSIVITGSFEDVITFGKYEPNETTLISDGGRDIFVARYNTDGTLDWAKKAGGTAWNSGRSIGVLADNSVIVTGEFYQSVVFGEGEPNETTITSPGGTNTFIALYNPDGTFEWVKQTSAVGSTITQALAILPNNAISITGYFSGTAVFGEGEPNETSLTTATGEAFFIAQYNPDGTLSWAKMADAPSEAAGTALTALSDNSTIVTGAFDPTITFNVGEPDEITLTSDGYYDVFLAKYDIDGTLMWLKHITGPHVVRLSGLAALTDDSIVGSGYFEESVIYGKGEPNETELTAMHQADFSIARFEP